jgi:Tfp pilus assembly protein PilO
MKLPLRDLVLLGITAVILLFGITYMIAVPKIRNLQALRQDQIALNQRVAMTERLVAQTGQWESRLRDQRQSLPAYPAAKDVTADMLIEIENMARQNGVALLSRDVEKEVQHGSLFELSVNCKWEGTLKAIVAFLFEIQQKGAMLDISQLTIAPNEKRVLRGTFTINSSYTREPSGAAVGDALSVSPATNSADSKAK